MADIKAIVEGVERYALGDYQIKNLRIATYAEMKEVSLTPEQLGTTSEQLEAAGAIHWCSFHADNQTRFALLDWAHHPVDYNELQRLLVGTRYFRHSVCALKYI